MNKHIEKLFQKNGFVKPLAVVTASTPSVAYLLSNTSELFITQNIPGSEDIVAVSTELIKSFQGSLVLLVLMISIVNIYKPPKTIIISLVIGGMALVASSLLQTIGVTFLTYGLGLLFNTFTLNHIIERNEKLQIKKMDNEVDNLLKEAKR